MSLTQYIRRVIAQYIQPHSMILAICNPPLKSLARVSLRSEMRGASVFDWLAYWMCIISETCYRYRAKLSSENAEIADWLIRLAHNQRN